MITRRWKLIVPLLVALLMAGATAAMAQLTLRVQLGTYPHWSQVGTLSVDELPVSERPGYDVWRYGGRYYAYSGDRWYVSDRESGYYTQVDDSYVPQVFMSIPRDHWHYYPSAWNDDRSYGTRTYDDRTYARTRATFRVDFGGRRHWLSVGGTAVDELPANERPNYDVFRYQGRYYAYVNGRWYSSSYETGDFDEIEVEDVPVALTNVPRSHWRDYPSGWRNAQYDDDRDLSVGSATLYVRFDSEPRWSTVRGTTVRVLRNGPADRDMFRYEGHFWVYTNGRWYSSTHHQGTFRMVSSRDVPAVFASVPRDYWRNYPDEWPDARRHHRRGWRD